MNTTTQLPDLKSFCDPDVPTLREPFSEGDWTYYGNRRFIVRVPRDPTVSHHDNAPKNLEQHIFRQTDPIFQQPLSELKVPDLKGPDICDNCGGSGQCDCTCGTTHECGECKGTGKSPEKAKEVKVGHHKLNHLLLHKIKTLPGVVLLEYDQNPISPVGFTFDGGEGRLAPMKPK